MIKAEIVADSLSPQGDRLTSVLVTMPRIILSEMNTHRMLCLAGDTEISFDLPTPASGSTNFKHYTMTIKDFVEKWYQGAKKRKRHSSIVDLEDRVYTVKEISTITGKHPSNIRSKCRDKTIQVLNPDKKNRDDFLINGLMYNEYHNGFETKGQNIRERLKRMKIRILNEDTKMIEHSFVKDCFISGEKSIFKLTLEDGKELRCSKDHRILTENGWKALEYISTDDYVIVQSFGLFEGEKSDPSKYQYINGKWVSQFLREIRSEIVERQNNKCQKCDNSIDDLHHIIPIHQDISKTFEKDNIIGLCKECHNKEHEKQGWQTSKYLYGKGIKVSKIEEDGFEQTYDLEIEGEFPNFIANGIVVHNSKNTSSSRAVPFNKMVEAVQNNPFIPIAWQKEHKGMQGTEYWIDDDTVTVDEGGEYERHTKIYSATEHFITEWLEARDFAIAQSYELNRLGVTKQLCNRLLEPFMWTTMLITGSKEGWNNFFELRCPSYFINNTGQDYYFKSKKEAINFFGDEEAIDSLSSNKEVFLKNLSDLEWSQINKGQAEIHLMDLAEKIYDAMNESTPEQLESGQWHIPMIEVIED